jgi:lipopolysaccharide transport system permease protein
MKSFLGIFTRLFGYRELIVGLTRREIFGRYRGSYFGILWSFLTPLITLSVYLLVFGFVFKSRFGYTAQESATDFGLALFCGLNLFNMFAEVLTRSSGLILQHPNYVKKVVFPLEIIPISATGSALFHCLMAYVPMIALLVIFHTAVPFSALFIPVYLLPLTILALGVSWGVAALGVFIRDLQLFLTSVVTVLMFLSAVFYPLQAVPSQLRIWIYLNPLAGFLDSARKSIVWGMAPDWMAYFVFFAWAISALFLGYLVFSRSKRAFADVI